MQEIAYSLATAIGVLDAVRDSGQVAPERVRRRCSARSRSSSTPASASSRRSASCAPSPSCGTASALERYGVDDAKARRFRYGVQVNSLGLTEAQPENNVQRIVLEMLGVTLSKRARARSHPAAGVERGARPAPPVGPAVVVADAAGAGVRDRPARVRRPLRRLARRSRRARPSCVDAAQAELDDVLALGGAFEAIDDAEGAGSSASMAERTRRIESGDQIVVGVNRFTETAPSPLGGDGRDPDGRPGGRGRDGRRRASVAGRRATTARSTRALDELRRVPRRRRRTSCRPTIALAQAGGTTGEWGGVLREVFGEYRAPTGVGRAPVGAGGELADGRRAGARRCPAARRSCSSPSRASTATPTAPSRSPSPPATPGMEVVYSGHPPHARADRRRRPATRTPT